VKLFKFLRPTWDDVEWITVYLLIRWMEQPYPKESK
jgi:hypothetical protein